MKRFRRLDSGRRRVGTFRNVSERVETLFENVFERVRTVCDVQTMSQTCWIRVPETVREGVRTCTRRCRNCFGTCEANVSERFETCSNVSERFETCRNVSDSWDVFQRLETVLNVSEVSRELVDEHFRRWKRVSRTFRNGSKRVGTVRDVLERF